MVLSHKDMQDNPCPVLFFANKSDLPDALEPVDCMQVRRGGCGHHGWRGTHTWRTTIVPEVVVSGLVHMCCTTTIYHYGPFRYVPTMSMLCDILVRRVVLCTGRCVRYHPWSLWSVKVVYAGLHWSSILVSTLVSNYGLYDCLYGRCWNSMPSKTAPGTSRELGVWRERERERERERMTESVLAKWEGTNYTRMYALSQTNMLNLFLSSIVDTSYGCPLVRPSPLVVRFSSFAFRSIIGGKTI